MVHLPLIPDVPGLHCGALLTHHRAVLDLLIASKLTSNSEFFRRFQSTEQPLRRGCLQSEGARRMIAVPLLIAYNVCFLSLVTYFLPPFSIKFQQFPQRLDNVTCLLPHCPSHVREYLRRLPASLHIGISWVSPTWAFLNPIALQ